MEKGRCSVSFNHYSGYICKTKVTTNVRVRSFKTPTANNYLYIIT